MALYHCDLPHGARENAMETHQGSSAGDRNINCDINVAGNYAIAVYKSKRAGIGQTASYNIAVAPKGIYLISPNGGETTGLGEWQDIRWFSLGDVGSNVNIKLSRDGGQTWNVFVSSTPNDGLHSWKVCMSEISGDITSVTPGLDTATN